MKCCKNTINRKTKKITIYGFDDNIQTGLDGNTIRTASIMFSEYAEIKTLKGENIYDGINPVISTKTHLFIVKWNSNTRQICANHGIEYTDGITNYKFKIDLVDYKDIDKKDIYIYAHLVQFF